MADNPITLIGALLTGLGGTALGAVMTAVVQMLGHKGESRATAADLVTHAAGGLAAQQDKTIDRLAHENAGMRKAILGLSDVIDQLLPRLELPEQEMAELRAAVRAAKMAV